MNPIIRLAAIGIVAAIAVGGALYLVKPPLGPAAQLTPSRSAPPPSIDGTWDVDFTHAEMVAAGLVDTSEDNAENYGHFRMTFADGAFQIMQLDGPRASAAGTYSMSGATITIRCSGWCDNDAVFVMQVTVAPTTLTFASGPVTFHVKPWSRVTPEPIEGTWDVTFSRQEMLAAGLADSAEDNNENYGHFILSIHGGVVTTMHLAPVTAGGSVGTYVISGNTFTVTTEAKETFSWPFTVTGTTLTFGTGGPVTLRVKPWSRIGP